MSHSYVASKEKKGFTTRELALIAMFSAVISVCSWISVPVQVPFTLQTFGVFCAVLILGGRNGLFSILVYILLGLIGLPVFAEFSGGVSALMSPSGGYIWGFIFIAAIYWSAGRLFGEHMVSKIIALIIGMTVCYVFGTAWFMYIYTKQTGTVTLLQALKWCVFPFIPFDLIKMALAVAVSERVKKYARN